MREKTYSPVVATAIRGDKKVMEPHRDRQAVFEKGPRFFELNGKLMFAFRIDPSTEIGPMEATDKHIADHLSAFEAFKDEVCDPTPLMMMDVKNIKVDHDPHPHWNNAGEKPKRGPGRPRKDEVAAA